MHVEQRGGAAGKKSRLRAAVEAYPAASVRLPSPCWKGRIFGLIFCPLIL